MAFTSGTATDYLDLLNRLKQFVTQDMLPANERWSVLCWVPGPPAELVLQGPGLAGTEQINVGILCDPSLLPDPDSLGSGFTAAIDALARAAARPERAGASAR